MRFWMMAGVLAVTLIAGFAAPAGAVETHVVQVKGDAFDPPNLTIQQGDRVRWELEAGAHTIASGLSPEDEEAGALFEATLSQETPAFEFAFGDLGIYSYFSRQSPETMKGTITVLTATPVTRKTWGFLKQMFESQASLR